MFPFLILLLAFLFVPVGLFFSLSIFGIALGVGLIMLLLALVTGIIRAIFGRPPRP